MHLDDGPPSRAASVPAADQDVIMGFKRITPENFTLPDLSRAFGLADHAQWIAWFDEARLEAAVPEPVRRLFELARGSMIYAWLYYPLVSVGLEQCGRCLEAGVRYAAVSLLGCQPPDEQKVLYRSLIERMIKHGHIAKSEKLQWLAALALRNDAAHPIAPRIWAPGQAHAKLALTAERLNALFARSVTVGGSAMSNPG